MLSAVAMQPDAAPPSAELLLYLGEFEDADGDFVDPMAIDASAALPTAEQAPVESPVEDEKDDEPAPQSA